MSVSSPIHNGSAVDNNRYDNTSTSDAVDHSHSHVYAILSVGLIVLF